MLLVDANVLLHAANEGAAEHDAAAGWLGDAVGGPEAVGFAWTVLLAVLRLSTHPSVFPRPLSVPEATALVTTCTDAPAAVVVEPTPRHLGILSGLLREARTGGNLVNDAHLAALALEHDATLVSFDRDFARFPGVRVHRPAEPA